MAVHADQADPSAGLASASLAVPWCIGLVSGQVVGSLTPTAMVHGYIGSLQQVFNFFALRPLTTASVGFWPDGTNAPLCGTSSGCKQATTSALNTRRKVWQF